MLLCGGVLGELVWCYCVFLLLNMLYVFVGVL